MRAECPLCGSINLIVSVITETAKEGLFVDSEITVNNIEKKIRMIACMECKFTDYDDGTDHGDNLFELCERKIDWHNANPGDY